MVKAWTLFKYQLKIAMSNIACKRVKLKETPAELRTDDLDFNTLGLHVKE